MGKDAMMEILNQEMAVIQDVKSKKDMRVKIVLPSVHRFVETPFNLEMKNVMMAIQKQKHVLII